MDIIIRSKIMNGILERYIKKAIKKRVREDIEITINDLGFKSMDNVTTMNIRISAKVDTKDIPAILTNLGLL